MAEHLCCIAQRHKVPIHSFRFEITESALSYEQRLQQNMDMLIAQAPSSRSTTSAPATPTSCAC